MCVHSSVCVSECGWKRMCVCVRVCVKYTCTESQNFWDSKKSVCVRYPLRWYRKIDKTQNANFHQQSLIFNQKRPMFDQKSPHQQWLMSINTHMMRAYSSKEPCIHSKEMFNQTRCSVKRVLSTVFWYDKHRQTDKSHDANLDQKSSRFHQ